MSYPDEYFEENDDDCLIEAELTENARCFILRIYVRDVINMEALALTLRDFANDLLNGKADVVLVDDEESH